MLFIGLFCLKLILWITTLESANKGAQDSQLLISVLVKVEKAFILVIFKSLLSKFILELLPSKLKVRCNDKFLILLFADRALLVILQEPYS